MNFYYGEKAFKFGFIQLQLFLSDVLLCQHTPKRPRVITSKNLSSQESVRLNTGATITASGRNGKTYAYKIN